MAVVVDPPLFICLFKTSDPKHERFLPLRDWVINGKAKFVYGGTKYKKELAAVKSIIPTLRILEQKGKIYRLLDADVDSEEEKVKEIEKSNDFDDPHLAAIVRASRIKIICIDDPRSHKFLKNPKLYVSTKDKPKLYTKEKNKNILKPEAICGSCY